jgi:hypothetical protein
MTKKLVLSVSGGGALGVGPLQFMKRLEKDLGTELYKVCEGYAGTSTGSIIVSGLSNEMTAEKLLDLYKKNLSNIFKERKIKGTNVWPLNKISVKDFTAHDIALVLQSNYYRYDNKGLKKLLEENFPYKMNKHKKPIFIPTTFMNGKSAEKVWDNGDKNVDQSFAVLTSCSAPTYFDVVKDGGNEYCDGGLWANDPIMVLESGIKKFSKDAKYKETFADGFKILSFNTGMLCPNKAPKKKNIFGWLSYIMDDWVARTGNSNLFEARANIGAENVFRCEPTVTQNFDMDNLKEVDKVIKIWDEYYDSVKKDVLKFVKSTM